MANVTISNLPAATTLGSDDLLAIVQGGITKRTTAGTVCPLVSIEQFGGGVNASAATNMSALDDIFTEFTGSAVIVQFGSAGEYQFGDQIDMPVDVSFQGVGYPGSDVANQSPQMTRIKRVADVKLINIVGGNRTTGRVGRNGFRNIGFSETLNVSSQSLIYAKYADSLVFEHSGYFGSSTAPTAIGHILDVEECWDWLLFNTLFKQGGLAATSKYVMNIYNGADDSTNDWKMIATRFQESYGTNINFDSSGGGNNNERFWLAQCKFEDARATILTPIHIQGLARRLMVNQTVFSGCTTRHIDMNASSIVWEFAQSQFARGKSGAGMTEYLKLPGTKATVRDCVFDSPPAALTQYINTTGGDAEIAGNRRTDTTPPLINSASVATSSKIHHNPDFLTEWGTTATLTNAGNTLTITHGMAYTPNLWDITVMFTGAPNNGIDALRVSTITSTQFSVTSYADGVATTPASDIGIAWKIQRVRG